MDKAPPDAPIDRHRAKRWLNAVGVRVVGYGGFLLLVGLLFVDIRSMMAPAPVETTTTGERPFDPDSGPGWPHLRGPHYNSTSDEIDLADQWPDEGPPVLWFRHIGPGYSGFSAVGERVYTQRQTLYYQSVLCMDGHTGSTVWEHRYGLPYDAAGMYPGPRSTPTWHEGRIYFAGPSGLVGCLDASDGDEIWSRKLYKIEPLEPENREEPDDRLDTDPLAVRATRVWFSRRMSNDVASSVLVAALDMALDGGLPVLFGHVPGLFPCAEDFEPSVLVGVPDRVSARLAGRDSSGAANSPKGPLFDRSALGSGGFLRLLLGGRCLFHLESGSALNVEDRWEPHFSPAVRNDWKRLHGVGQSGIPVEY